MADLSCSISSYAAASPTSFNDINILGVSELAADGLSWGGSSTLVNVLNYGATANNGSTDATAAINSAIAATPSGGTVYFPTGTYIVSSTITVPTNIRLLGDWLGLSTIRLSAGFSSSNPLITSNYDGVAGTYLSSNIRFENLVFDGNNNAGRTGGGYLLQLIQINNLKIIKCGFINNSFITVALAGNTNVDIWGSKFANCGIPRPTTTSSPALFVGGTSNYAGANTNVNVNKCVFRNNNWSGSYFFATGGSVRNSVFVNNGESSIFTNDTTANITFENNYFYGAIRSNISASGLELGGSNLTIRNNFFRGNASDGLSITNVKTALVEYNTSYDNRQETTYAAFQYGSGFAITTINGTTEFADNITFRYNRAFNSSGTSPQVYGLLFYKNQTLQVENSTISNNNFYNNTLGDIGNLNNGYNPATVTFTNNISNSGDLTAGASVVQFVNDIICGATPAPVPPPPTPTYSFSSPGLGTTVLEGATINFTVSTTNVSNGTVLWWATISESNASAADILTPSPPYGSVTINSNSGSISLTIATDLVTPESNDIFYLRLYLTESDRNSFVNHVAQSNNVTIIDVPPPAPAPVPSPPAPVPSPPAPVPSPPAPVPSPPAPVPSPPAPVPSPPAPVPSPPAPEPAPVPSPPAPVPSPPAPVPSPPAPVPSPPAPVPSPPAPAPEPAPVPSPPAPVPSPPAPVPSPPAPVPSPPAPVPSPVPSCGPYSDIVVTGSLSGGTVWGSNPYTDDSDWNRAAVHAGLIGVGETATISRTSVGYISNFIGSGNNGILTQNYSGSWCGVTIALVSPAPSPVPSPPAPEPAPVPSPPAPVPSPPAPEPAPVPSPPAPVPSPPAPVPSPPAPEPAPVPSPPAPVPSPPAPVPSPPAPEPAPAPVPSPPAPSPVPAPVPSPVPSPPAPSPVPAPVPSPPAPSPVPAPVPSPVPSPPAPVPSPPAPSPVPAPVPSPPAPSPVPSPPAPSPVPAPSPPAPSPVPAPSPPAPSPVSTTVIISTQTDALTIGTTVSTLARLDIAFDYSEGLNRFLGAIENITNNVNTLTQAMTTGSGVRVVKPYDWIQGMQLDKLYTSSTYFNANFPKWDPYN